MTKKNNTFKVGDKVAVLDDDFSGTVIRINGIGIFVETKEGFELEFLDNQLIKMVDNKDLLKTSHSDLLFEKVNEDLISKRKSNQQKTRKKERFEPTMEVDLHAHKLLNSTKGMTKHDILTFQLDTARHKLEFAIRKKIQKLVFIHGVGEGVLKMELDYLFGRYDNVKFYDADYQKYGVGATEVYVYQNAKRI